MAKQTITAFYDSREYANNAALMLRQAGVPVADVTVSPESASIGPAEETEPHAKGFWASLENLFGGTDDHATYAEGLRRGGIMLTAHVDDPKVDDAVRILEQHGSVDLNERETAWRGEGWTGGSAITGGGVADMGAGPLRSMESAIDTKPVVAPALTRAATTKPTAAPTASAPSVRAGTDDALQVVEESLSVGKRAINRGAVRIHSYVVEKAVSESVTLRDETISIDRRPVDRALTAGELGVDAFKDRTIEMEEIDEEAVVAKTVRVVEEIGLRKEVRDEVKTITDTVRSTKVDIEDGRTAGVGVAASGVSSKPARNLEVVGSDGQHVGVIDQVDGSAIRLKASDQASGGKHHVIPADWVKAIDNKVVLKVTAADAKSRWTAA